MTDAQSDAFRSLLDASIEELRIGTAAHDAAWRLCEADWNLDQHAGTIVFTRPDGFTATCSVQIVGTYNTRDGTWLWGWDHPSVLPSLRRDAEKVREYGIRHRITELTGRKVVCSENEAWKFTALARKLSGAQGAYRGPADSTLIFMTFDHVKLSQR
jgi:hypothetical protein